MARPNITITNHANCKLVSFEIPGGVTTPQEFSDAVSEVGKQLPGELPVLINGRGPVWGYAMLVHEAHPTPAVATFDPRLGYIVVASHDSRWDVGSVVPDPEKSAE